MKTILIITLMMLTSAASASFTINGFGSFYGKYQITDTNKTKDEDYSYKDFSKVGFNLRSLIYKNTTFGGQAVAKSANQDGSWDLSVDWAFIDFALSESLRIRVGRQLFPLWMSSEYQDIGVELPYIKRPTAMQNISLLKAINGISIDYTQNYKSFEVGYRLFAGDEDGKVGDVDYSIKNVVGLNIDLNAPRLRVYLTASYYRLDLEATAQLPTGYTLIQTESKVSTATSGFSYRYNNFFNQLEYGVAYTDFGKDATDLSHNLYHGGYYLLGYHLGKFFPRYSFSYEETKNLGNATDEHTSHTVGLNYKYADGKIVFKTELSYEDGRVGENEETETGRILVGLDAVF